MRSALPNRYSAACRRAGTSMGGSLGGRGARSRPLTRSEPWLAGSASTTGRSSICWTCSLPVTVWVARRAPARLHRHRRLRPLPPDGRVACDAHPWLRCVRAAAEQYAVQQGQHPRTTTESNVANSMRLGAAPRPTSQRRHHRPGVLSLDPVDLHPDFRSLVRRRGGPKAGRSPSWSTSWRTGTGRPPTAARGRSCRRGSSMRSSTAIGSLTWPTARSTGARGSARCWPTRKSPPTGAATSATSRHSAALCGSGCCASPPMPTDCWTIWTPWSGRIDQDHAAQLDRAQRWCQNPVPDFGGPYRGVHSPTRHCVRCHLHGAGAGASAGRRAAAADLADQHPRMVA